MNYFVWTLIGLFAGLSLGRMLGHPVLALAFDVALGIAGAVTGGWLYSMYGDVQGSSQLSLNSIVMAGLGAVVLLLAQQAAPKLKSSNKTPSTKP